jgi:adenylosuccinate synthase
VSKGLIQIIQGGQYGSEAKGAIAAYLCQKDNVDYAVRTGATNAGHTVVHGGTAYKMQQLPVGWVNPKTKLVIGAGALIDMAILDREIKMINAAMPDANILDRLFIDYRAGIHDTHHADESALSGRHRRIGATGKGCSGALIAKINNRGLEPMTIGDRFPGISLPLHDTCTLLNQRYNEESLIQLEGTQGTLLDLHLGPYPYVTHKQTGPSQWMMEAGLSPNMATEIWMVVRTFPIRVAGNSGPLPKEVGWGDLAREINTRLISKGLPPLIAPWAINAFLEAQMEAQRRYFDELPVDGTSQHTIVDQDDRTAYQRALSELNTMALGMLPPDTVTELRKLLEFTTVTKKLRRIGLLDHDDLRNAAMQVRPHQIALTFMNYLFPEHWHATNMPPYSVEVDDYIAMVASACGADVGLVNWGPNPSHITAV